MRRRKRMAPTGPSSTAIATRMAGGPTLAAIAARMARGPTLAAIVARVALARMATPRTTTEYFDGGVKR